MKNVNKLYLFIICIADAIVAAIVIINPIHGLARPRQDLGHPRECTVLKAAVLGAPLI